MIRSMPYLDPDCLDLRLERLQRRLGRTEDLEMFQRNPEA
jgi:hypothetical protein